MGPIIKYYYLCKKEGCDDAKILEMALWAGNSVEYMTMKYLYHGGDLPKPLAKVEKFVPLGPNHKDTVRIALLLFAGSLFKDCPSYEKVRKELGDITYLRFDGQVPESFFDLLEESRQKDYLKEYEVFESSLELITKY